MPGIDLQKLRDTIKAGNKVVYANSNNSDTAFLDIRRKDNWNPTDKCYQTDIRVVMLPGTAGFAYRVMHPYVGYPGKSPKSFTCPKQLNGDAECILCEIYNLSTTDPDFENTRINFPSSKDGVPVIKATSLKEIINNIRPQPWLILTVVEPKWLDPKYESMEDGDPQKPDKKLTGVQVFFAKKASLVSAIDKTMKNFPDDYFTDPKEGAMLRIIYTPDAAPAKKYDVMPYRVKSVPEELVKTAPDCEVFTTKIVSEDKMRDALQAMLPGIDL